MLHTRQETVCQWLVMKRPLRSPPGIQRCRTFVCRPGSCPSHCLSRKRSHRRPRQEESPRTPKGGFASFGTRGVLTARNLIRPYFGQGDSGIAGHLHLSPRCGSSALAKATLPAPSQAVWQVTLQLDWNSHRTEQQSWLEERRRRKF